MEAPYIFIFSSPYDPLWKILKVNQALLKRYFCHRTLLGFMSLIFVKLLSCLLCEVPKLLVFHQRVLYEHESVKTM